MTSITVPMENELRSKLEKEAQKRDRSLAYVVRDACSLFLQEVSDTLPKEKLASGKIRGNQK